VDDKKVAFLPFHAINQFMIDEYRSNVIRTIFQRFNDLSADRRSAINRMIKIYMQVPGFRNSALAPLPLKVRGAANAFEKYPSFTAQILQAWSELHTDLRQRVYDVLKHRNWELLPPEVDRTKLPGFLPKWIKGENYDILDKAFFEDNPDYQVSTDDIRLMVVWLSGRLPFDMDEADETTDKAEEHI